MDIETNFKFSFICREQIQVLCEILRRENRLNDLRKLLEFHYFTGEKPVNPFCDIHTFEDNTFEGDAGCFSEYDVQNLLPNVLREISELLPENDFEAEVSINPDSDYLWIEGKYSYKNGRFFVDCKDIDYRPRNGNFILMMGLFNDDTIDGYDGSERIITIPDDIKTISDGAFNNNDTLEELISGFGLKSIGAEAFYNCQNLKEVILSENVESIGVGAFAECLQLNKIVIANNSIRIDDDVFMNDENVVIYAHIGSSAQNYAEKNGIKFEVK